MKGKLRNTLEFVVYSLMGIIFFFIRITLKGSISIPLDHVVTFFQEHLATLSKVLILIAVICGGILPFIQKDWERGKSQQALSFSKF